MIRFPRNYRPGIPTLSPEDEKRWMLYCEMGRLDAYQPTEVTHDDLVARGRAMGMDDAEIKWHLSAL